MIKELNEKHLTEESSASIERAFPALDDWTEKRDMGDIAIVAGAAGMAGAAMLAALSAYRAGAGLVRVITNLDNSAAINSFVPEAIVYDVANVPDGNAEQEPKNQDDDLAQNHFFSSRDAVAIGPGMGRGEQTKGILKELLWHYNGPIVLDADALNAIAESRELQTMTKMYQGEIVMTPHIREAARLLGGEYENSENREEIAGRLYEKYKSVILLKGHETLIYNGNEFYVNLTGNPGMATAGSGDVLTGIIAAILGRGVSAIDAAKAGSYVHGLAGDFAAEEKGYYSVIARDIIDALPRAITSR